jgi:hypothetical protein
MASAVFFEIKALEKARLRFYTERTRPRNPSGARSSAVRAGLRAIGRCAFGTMQGLIRLPSPARKLRGLGIPAL